MCVFCQLWVSGRYLTEGMGFWIKGAGYSTGNMVIIVILLSLRLLRRNTVECIVRAMKNRYGSSFIFVTIISSTTVDNDSCRLWICYTLFVYIFARIKFRANSRTDPKIPQNFIRFGGGWIKRLTFTPAG